MTCPSLICINSECKGRFPKTSFHYKPPPGKTCADRQTTCDLCEEELVDEESFLKLNGFMVEEYNGRSYFKDKRFANSEEVRQHVTNQNNWRIKSIKQ